MGGVGIILVLAAILLFYRQSRNPKAARRGDILGATQLRGPENYRYKDLKFETKKFSKENKLGEGSFDEVSRGGVQTSEFSTSRHLAGAVTTECGVRAEIGNRRGRDRKSCSGTGNRAELAEQRMEAREEIDFLL
nr:cysteine-rich receptor-like protein kinase 2 [Ipomoea batatas]